MKKNIKIILIIIGIIIVYNIYPFVWLFKNFVDERHYRYSNYNGSNTFTEFMSRNFEMMKSVHKNCLLNHPKKDKNIYRLFKKNPLAFWRWRLYFFDERYKLPYKDWEEIKKVRAKEKVTEKTGCLIEF